MLGKKILKIAQSAVESCLKYKSFKRPIFIIAPPRSGSTLLFECLSQFEELVHLPFEADSIWWHYFPYDRMSDPSDYISQALATDKNIRRVRRHIYKAVISQSILQSCKGADYWSYKLGQYPIRYLDKTIANCFHLDFLEQAFPDAQYIFLVRDPRATISSMIQGWPYCDRFGKPQLGSFLKHISNASIQHWSYPAPPHWRTVVSKPLPEICAWSWQQHIHYALQFFTRRSQSVIQVRYEDLSKNPALTIQTLAQQLGLRISKASQAYAEHPPLSRTTLSVPYPQKWQALNRDDITSLYPQIEMTAQKIGYDISLNF